MTPDMKELPAELGALAGKLTEAQRQALLGIPANAIFRPAYSGFRWATLAVLKSKGLIRSVTGAYGKMAEHRFSDKGLTLRTYLQANPIPDLDSKEVGR